jgi:hypothetical protein
VQRLFQFCIAQIETLSLNIANITAAMRCKVEISDVHLAREIQKVFGHEIILI